MKVHLSVGFIIAIIFLAIMLGLASTLPIEGGVKTVIYMMILIIVIVWVWMTMR